MNTMLIRRLLTTLVAALALTLSPGVQAAEPSKPAPSKTEPSKPAMKTSFYDQAVMQKLEAESRDASLSAQVRQGLALQMRRDGDLTSNTRAAARVFEDVLKRYPDKFLALEVRCHLLQACTALYTQAGDEDARQREFAFAHEGLRKVDQLAPQVPGSEYMEWVRGEYLSPLMSLGGEAPKDAIERVRAFYHKALEDQNLAPTARVMLLYRLIDLELHEKNYNDATAAIGQGLDFCEKLVDGKDTAGKQTGLGARVNFLFLAVKVAILKGDKPGEQQAIAQLKSVTPENRQKNIDRAIARLRMRTAVGTKK